MAFWILAAGLFFLPLTGSIIIEPVLSIVHNSRETLALIVCLFFSTYVYLYEHGKLSRLNVSLASTIVFLIFCINASPKISLMYEGQNLGNLWEWKAFAITLIYYLFYLSFAKMRLSLKKKEDLCRIIGLTAVISSIYAISQALGLDQSQVTRLETQIGHPDVPHITAMLINPTFLSIYLVAALPFVWQYFKKYVTIPVIVAIVLCQSDTGYFGLVFMLLAWSFCKLKFKGRIALVVWIFTATCFLINFKHDKIQGNGRFETWQQAWHEFYNPPIVMEVDPTMSFEKKSEIRKLNKKRYIMTGLGLGSFKTYHKNSKYKSIHNIYFEVLYCTGFIGLFLFLSTLFESFFCFFKRKIKHKVDYLILFSFVFLLLASLLHSTILHEPLRFLMAFLFCSISMPKNNA